MRILILEDNEEDIALLQDAFARCGVTDPLYFVRNADAAIDYLKGTGPYTDRRKNPLPTLLLIDLKLPQASGLELLRWFKAHPECRVVPTLVLTASEDERMIADAYDLAASTYFVKPASHMNLCALIKVIYEYWSVARVPVRTGDA